MAEIHGYTSKIERYYWRELHLDTYRAIREWALANGYASGAEAVAASPGLETQFRDQVKQRIKESHAVAPKYDCTEPSQAEVIDRYNVEVRRLDATFITGGRRARLDWNGELVSPEEYVQRHYRGQGYEVIRCESEPFHALFGTMTWLLYQHHSDPALHRAGFGDRFAVDAGTAGSTVWTSLPEDFGAPGYAHRRRDAIEEFFSEFLPKSREELLHLFDYWVSPSAPFRQYLWAHRPDAVARARQILEVVPAPKILEVLRYLVESYWERYCGWPDLLIVKGGVCSFTEVKASKDSLSLDQCRWIADNAGRLRFPFFLTKIHRARSLTEEEWMTRSHGSR